jgi:2-methylaconitate isomerase
MLGQAPKIRGERKPGAVVGQKRLKAVFMRGGTSKGLVFHARNLPARAEWDDIFLAAMGSPDPYVRQLDGMGGGVSSLSKICVVGPASVPGADIDYTFAQVSVTDRTVDYAGNCGNMSSAMGPFAIDEGLVARPPDGETIVRIHNTNTGKIIAAHIQVRDGEAEVGGDFELDGVAGLAAPIRLDFLEPGGAKTGRLLPTGRAIDLIEVPGFGVVEASIVDAANPFVFVLAEALGASGTELPKTIAANTVLQDRLEQIRLRASVLMGLAATLEEAAAIISLPKVAMLSAPGPSPILSERVLQADETDLMARAISVGQPHNAIPLTGALCLAVAARTPGTIANRIVGDGGGAAIRIGHPSGTITVDADVAVVDGRAHARSACVYRTARRLFAGEVYISQSK